MKELLYTAAVPLIRGCETVATPLADMRNINDMLKTRGDSVEHVEMTVDAIYRIFMTQEVKHHLKLSQCNNRIDAMEAIAGFKFKISDEYPEDARFFPHDLSRTPIVVCHWW